MLDISSVVLIIMRVNCVNNCSPLFSEKLLIQTLVGGFFGKLKKIGGKGFKLVLNRKFLL